VFKDVLDVSDILLYCAFILTEPQQTVILPFMSDAAQ